MPPRLLQPTRLPRPTPFQLFLLGFGLMPCCFGATAPGRFGNALAPSRTGVLAAARPEYDGRPLTIECWAKVNSKSGFNILVANERKSSPTHWELYSYVGTGFLSLYMPSNKPAEIKSARDVADGTWHYLAAVLDGERIRLYVDGAEVASVAETRPKGLEREVGGIAFGALVSGHLGCDGSVDEVRLSNVVRETDAIPPGPFGCDDCTIGLWHFDEPRGTDDFADASPGANHARLGPPAYARQPATGAPSLVKMPPEPDLVSTRAATRQALAKLNWQDLIPDHDLRDGVLREWEEQYWHLANRVSGRETLPKGAAEQVFDRQALVLPDDGDPLGVVLRRTQALADHLRADRDVERSPPPHTQALGALASAAARTPVADAAARKRLFLAACALRRRIALTNPLLDFDDILFVARGVYGGSRKTGPRVTNDFIGQHFATQYFGFNSVPGGGLFVVRGWKTRPEVVDVLADSVVTNARLKGRRLDGGAYLSPDLSFDGRTILFSWTENREHKYIWSPSTSWNVFRVNADGSGLAQLTDSEWDDFDACWLPNGRIVFISERRGGYIRCFASLPVPQHVMHSMAADGSDLFPISYFETSEWHPSVNNDGMIVYTRWDYVDRENCLGSNFWICNPDGRDPRAPHGNYPYPWHTFEDNTARDSRVGRPYTEMNIRAIPGSHRYVTTAAPHHGEAFGSLVMLDLRQPDDGSMSQLRRITPYPPFPESEMPGRSQYPYGTAWPLSEDVYLCNWWENLYLLDRFGNRVLVCENSLVFGGKTNWDMRLIDPIPLRARPRPPVIPTQTSQRAAPSLPEDAAVLGIVNVYDSDIPFPPGTRIRWLRVVQNILKPNHEMGKPMIGHERENTPRIPLGIVPVEADGSACLQVPPGKELIFHVLDENGMAVQAMRSVTYLHPGERLTCAGCHENVQAAPAAPGPPLAFRRPPSCLQPEAGPVEPITYYRLVRPVFERTCVPCHRRTGKGPADMSYGKLEPYVFYFAGGMRGSTTKPIHGGSRTVPGRFGARNSRMGRALLSKTHQGQVSADEFRRVILWLDCNSLRLGAFRDEAKQVRGEVVWPQLDVSPKPLVVNTP